MLFVSTRFLFPIDCGGRIRTVQILRGLKGGGFDVTLASPAPADWQAHFAHEIAGVCDRFATWPEPPRGPLFNWLRLRHVADPLPVPVATDRSNEGLRVVAAELVSRPDLLVLDFPHAAVLAPEATVPTVVFTHNVEAEIFARHALHAKSALRRGLWRSQERKMRRFEAAALARCAGIVAVSERDQQVLEREYRAGSVATIRTGVDLEYFTYGRKPEGAGVVFTGSMDWLPNIDGLEFFLEQVWPQVARGIPHASMTVVGRAPPPALIEAARRRGAAWEFTGWVEDVRPYVRRAKKAISNFKLRENNPIGLSLTLRGARMWEFLDRLMNAALPRVRDFRGVSDEAFDGRGNYSLGLSEQVIFPELTFDQVDRVRGLQVNIITTARTDAEGRRLLALLGMPFVKK